MIQLKNPSTQASKPSFQASLIYSMIVSLCSQGTPIPEVSYNQTLSLLKSLSPHVADIASITHTHYLATGVSGVTHFQALLNQLISNINLATLEEVNLAWAVMCHKGGSKPWQLAKSWRCIWTCPLIASHGPLCLQTPQGIMGSSGCPNTIYEGGKQPWTVCPCSYRGHHPLY